MSWLNVAQLQQTLLAVHNATWYDNDRGSWLACLLTVLIDNAQLARSRRRGADGAAERIAREFGQMVSPPPVVGKDGRADDWRNADDEEQFVDLARQLIDVFRVGDALARAFLRMQDQTKGTPFVAEDCWQRWWTWVHETFFASFPG